MKVIATAIPDLLVIEPKVFGDDRGFFFESYNQSVFATDVDTCASFVQDNHSRSAQGVLRGLHYQVRQAQGKLVRVVAGSVWDVAVDLRRRSPSFGRWWGLELSAENKRMVWIPKGFAHGFVVLSAHAEFLYKTTDFWAPQWERTIAWDDPDLAIPWPITGAPALSTKDQAGIRFREAECFD